MGLHRYLTFDDPNRISLDNCAYISNDPEYWGKELTIVVTSTVVFNLPYSSAYIYVCETK